MTADSSTCPYCNSNLPANLQPVRGRGLVCPRCQEVLPHTSMAANATNAAESAEAFEAGRARPSTKRVAAYVLSVMLVMAAIGLAFAWQTTATRRSRDRMADQTDPETLHTIVLAPAALPGLGYLPADVNMILGLNVAEGAVQEDSRRFLHAVRTLAGPNLETFVALPWDQIDHLIVGVRVEERLLPRFTLVVRSLRSIDKNILLKALKAQHKDRGQRALYTFPLEAVGIEGTLWIADDHTVVISRALDDFDPVPLKATPGIDRFNTDLQQVFKESLPAGVLLWLAAATRRGDQVLAPLVQFGMMTQPEADVLAALQRLGMWFRVEKKLETQAAAELRDEQAATKLKALLAQRGLATGQAPGGLEAREQCKRLAAQLKQSLKLEQKDSRLTLEASCTMDAFLEAVAR